MKRYAWMCLLALSVIGMVASPAAAIDKVKIGVLYPMSGPVAVYGQNYFKGVEMAVGQINGSGGVNVGGTSYELDPVIYDDKCDPKESVAALQKMGMEKIHFVIGPVCSSCTLASMAFNEELGIMMICHSVHPDITKKGNKLVVRVAATLDMGAMGLAETLVTALGWKGFATIADTSDYGRGWTNAFAEAVKKAGGKMIKEEWFEHGAVDFYPQLTSIKAAKPEAIFVIAAGKEAGLIVKQIKELGITSKIVVTESFDKASIEVAGKENVEGIYGSVAPFALYDSPERNDFVKAYEAKYKEPPQFYPAYSYDMVKVLARAMELAGTVTDAAKVRAKMNTAAEEILKPAPLSGALDIFDNGQVNIDACIGRYENGAWAKEKCFYIQK
jgi:branched-chain amino acid transport system substrate-binding protein